MLTAQWIWLPQSRLQPYNQAILARKRFDLDAVRSASLAVTADSWYRLFINGQWVCDGPARSWPEHYQYDLIDPAPYLRPGQNEIQLVARYWGAGTFHTRPQRPGLLLQLDAVLSDGASFQISTDASWQVAAARAWLSNTPKVSIQMEPQEVYDARLEDQLDFQPAEALAAAGEGPWRDLQPRDVPLLTRVMVYPQAFLGANLIRGQRDMNYTLPAAQLAHPGVIEANHNVSMVGGVAAVLEMEQPGVVAFIEEGVTIYLDGQRSQDGRYALGAGPHLVLAFITQVLGHNKEKSFRLVDPPPGMRLVNPLAADECNPWCYLAFPEYAYVDDDMVWQWFAPSARQAELLADYEAKVSELGHSVRDASTFLAQMGDRATQMPAEMLFVEDSHWQFLNREVIGPADEQVNHPEGLLSENGQTVIVSHSPEGDVELLYDLGKQNIGYVEFELEAEAGLQVDLYEVEYITPEGRIQHTYGNRNGLRYITRDGLNRFTSTKRRSGRYLFVTLRSQLAPVRIHRLRLIESTYPVDPIGSFHCSDPRLDAIWEISARTLKLCMEDTFTDCPLYEQTLWVGDARNESLYAYSTYDAQDIAQRCIRLAGQSLERYPLTGAQLPSSWDCLLPAWSFLWGISVWDYYFYTGDQNFLRDIWPVVISNLEGAEGLLDKHGLFSGPFWNMFDWSGIDDRHHTVLHNSLLLVGALDAAQKCAEVLGEEAPLAWLTDFRERLTDSINALWDDAKQAYPDSIHADGALSPSTSQHTSFLALLYDVIPADLTGAALANLLDPPAGMLRVGSPFAIQYFFEALEKAGQSDAILRAIYAAYLPMLEAGATTVWEVFPASEDRPRDFPTRSHCHAWSAAPLHFLSRIVLGVQPLTPGGEAYQVSPRLNGLAWAHGTVATARGPLSVAWKVEGDQLSVSVNAPEGVRVAVEPNDSMQGLKLKQA